MAAEFVIWGVDTPKGATEESLLLVAPGGKPITDEAAAQRYVAQLQGFGCTSLRIQRIDISEPFNFASMALGKGEQPR